MLGSLDDLDLDAIGQLDLGTIVSLGLRGGLVDPHVTDWQLPPELPGYDASPEEVAAWVAQREDFISSAPWVIANYMAVIQQAIDDWDREMLAQVLPEARIYLEVLADHITSAGSRRAEGTSIAEVLRLDRGLALAKDVDPAKLASDQEASDAMFDRVMQDLGGVLSLGWRNGTPQLNGTMALAAFSLGSRDLDLGSLERMGRELYAAVCSCEAPDEFTTAPLLSELDGRLARTVARRGSTPVPHADIPDRDIFYEFLAHRFAYAPDTPAFDVCLAANGYSHDDTYAFETKKGLGFWIVLPSEERRGELPPIVVFRGTKLDDLNDIRTDLELQIGQSHFEAVLDLGLEALLLGAIKDAGGRLPHITGHSLGGALAQLAAATWPDLVDEVVTFQAPGLSRRNKRFAKERLSEGHELVVRHYIADEDVVHLAGQRHLDGDTILVSGLKLEGVLGMSWGYGHTDLLLMDHAMRQRMVGMGLAAVWSPHQISAYAKLPVHPTSRGSGHEMVRSGLSVLLGVGRRFAAGERKPADVIWNLRHYVAEGLDQPDPSLRRAALTLAVETALSSVRGVGMTARFARRFVRHRLENQRSDVPPELMQQYADALVLEAQAEAERTAMRVAEMMAWGGDDGPQPDEPADPEPAPAG